MSASLPVPHAPVLPAQTGGAGAPEGAAVALPAPGVKSDDILRGKKTVEIIHNGSTYRLQATRLGKLILTK